MEDEKYVKINEQGFSALFKSKLPENMYSSQGVKFHEYVNHEVTLAVERDNPEVIAVLIRVMNFAKGTGLNSIYKEIPVRPRAISRAIKNLSEEDKKKVRDLVSSLTDQPEK